MNSQQAREVVMNALVDKIDSNVTIGNDRTSFKDLQFDDLDIIGTLLHIQDHADVLLFDSDQYCPRTIGDMITMVEQAEEFNGDFRD